MDTSEQYILMCQKAVDIQDLWEPKLGDFHCCPCTFCRDRGVNIFVIERAAIDILNKRDFTNIDSTYKVYAQEYGGHFADHFHEAREIITWLPRQDQLQKMLYRDWHQAFNGQYKFYRFCHGEYPSQPPLVVSHFHTMEQLWLAFVMSEKFNKTWNGGEWVDE